MLHCPTCGRAYAGDARFCPDDGARLVAAPPTGPPPSTAPPRSASSALDALLAESDARPPDSRPRYTQPVAPTPAAPTPVAPRVAAPAPPPAEPPAAETPRRSRALVVVLVVAALLVAALVAAALVLRGPNALEQEAYDALERGDMVTPTRVSAYDFAQRLATDHPAAAARVGQEAFPRLITAVDAFYARFYTTSEASADDWERTARLATWASEIAPADAHVRARAAYADARLAATRGETDAARTGYAAAAEAWPEWALPPNSLGRLLADARDERGAEAQYRTAARLDPAWPFPLSNLGALYLRQNRTADAADVLARAVRLDPERPYTHALLARALAAEGRHAEAVAEATDALRRDPAGAAGFDASSLRRDIGQWELAAQGVVDWDGDGVIEPENEPMHGPDDDETYYD